MRLLTRFAILVAFFAASLTAAAGLPTPESVLGFGPGAAFKLATYEQSVEYFKKLAAATKQRQDRRGRQNQSGTADVLRAGLNLTKIDRCARSPDVSRTRRD